MWLLFWGSATEKARNAGKTHQITFPSPSTATVKAKEASASVSSRASWLSRRLSNCSSTSSDRKFYLVMGWKHRKSISACLKFQHCIPSAETRKTASLKNNMFMIEMILSNIVLQPHACISYACTAPLYYRLTLASRNGHTPNTLYNPFRLDRCGKQSNKLDNIVNFCVRAHARVSKKERA